MELIVAIGPGLGLILNNKLGVIVKFNMAIHFRFGQAICITLI